MCPSRLILNTNFTVARLIELHYKNTTAKGEAYEQA